MFWWAAGRRCWLQVRGFHFLLPLALVLLTLSLPLCGLTGTNCGNCCCSAATPSRATPARPGPMQAPRPLAQHPRSLPLSPGTLHADPTRPRIRSPPRRPGSRSHPAQVRALRLCTATCPTYQLLGDELDGPRGRIYLIKQVLEGAEPTRATQMHLDSVPDLPQLRKHLSQRRAVRPPGGHWPQDRGRKSAPPCGRRRCAGR